MKNNTKRLLTIGYKREIRSARFINRHHIRVPAIHLSGKWLFKAGFIPGSIVEVEEKDNCLIIRKTPNSWCVEAMPENLTLNED